ncbi:MAG: glycosyltransferase family 4 protein [Phycisphaerales bacterium]|nr:glycosyltransferase family 4 protein [Phycisphaerales bacterium]
MNILFICDEYPPGLSGGIGSITQSLAREMVQQGHQVYVVGLCSYEYGQRNYEEDNGVKIWRLRYGFNFLSCSFLYKIQRKIPNVLKSFLYGQRNFDEFVRFVEKIIESNKIDIIEQPDWNTFAYDIGVKHPLFPKLPVPIVLKLHGSHSYSCHELQTKRNKHYANIDKQFFNNVTAVTSVSQYTADVNLELFGRKKSIITLYNSILLPNDKPCIPRKDNLVFFSGTLKETKGVFSLLKAWNLVKAKHRSAELILFGKGDIDVLKSLILPEYQSSVLFMGHQPREQLLSILEISSLAIFPSYIEAFSMAPLESMSKACPTIYTNRSSGREVIQDGINGFLVNPDDINSISEKILLLLNNADLRHTIGEAGKKAVAEKFEIKKSTKDHIEFYKSLITGFNT